MKSNVSVAAQMAYRSISECLQTLPSDIEDCCKLVEYENSRAEKRNFSDGGSPYQEEEGSAFSYGTLGAIKGDDIRLPPLSYFKSTEDLLDHFGGLFEILLAMTSELKTTEETMKNNLKELRETVLSKQRERKKEVGQKEKILREKVDNLTNNEIQRSRIKPASRTSSRKPSNANLTGHSRQVSRVTDSDQNNQVYELENKIRRWRQKKISAEKRLAELEGRERSDAIQKAQENSVDSESTEDQLSEELQMLRSQNEELLHAKNSLLNYQMDVHAVEDEFANQYGELNNAQNNLTRRIKEVSVKNKKNEDYYWNLLLKQQQLESDHSEIDEELEKLRHLNKVYQEETQKIADFQKNLDDKERLNIMLEEKLLRISQKMEEDEIEEYSVSQGGTQTNLENYLEEETSLNLPPPNNRQALYENIRKTTSKPPNNQNSFRENSQASKTSKQIPTSHHSRNSFNNSPKPFNSHKKPDTSRSIQIDNLATFGGPTVERFSPEKSYLSKLPLTAKSSVAIRKNEALIESLSQKEALLQGMIQVEKEKTRQMESLRKQYGNKTQPAKKYNLKSID